MRGLAAEQFDAREAAQMPISEKKSRANRIIDNSGPPQSTVRQVEEVWQTLLQIA
jgi:dephospho-CoA kinase